MDSNIYIENNDEVDVLMKIKTKGVTAVKFLRGKNQSEDFFKNTMLIKRIEKSGQTLENLKKDRS